MINLKDVFYGLNKNSNIMVTVRLNKCRMLDKYWRKRNVKLNKISTEVNALTCQTNNQPSRLYPWNPKSAAEFQPLYPIKTPRVVNDSPDLKIPTRALALRANPHKQQRSRDHARLEPILPYNAVFSFSHHSYLLHQHKKGEIQKIPLAGAQQQQRASKDGKIRLLPHPYTSSSR